MAAGCAGTSSTLSTAARFAPGKMVVCVDDELNARVPQFLLHVDDRLSVLQHLELENRNLSVLHDRPHVFRLRTTRSHDTLPHRLSGHVPCPPSVRLLTLRAGTTAHRTRRRTAESAPEGNPTHEVAHLDDDTADTDGLRLRWRIPDSHATDKAVTIGPDARVKRFHALAGLALTAALSSCGGGGPGSFTVPVAPSPPVTGGLACGVERWFVKTLSDPDAGRVNVAAVMPISIRELNGFDTHCSGLPERRAFAEEFRVFEVTGRIAFVAREADRDYHIALEDPNSPGFTVVTELADILCAGAVTSPHFSFLSAADAMWRILVDGRSPSSLVGVTVRVKGVGLYDFAHGQRGRSQNCIELHPILSIVAP